MSESYFYEADFSEFGYREIEMAAELMNEYLKSDIKPLAGLKVCFNANSGYVFLSDEDYNTFMMNGENFEQFFNCPNCGFEGFKEEFKDQIDCKDCQLIYKGFEELDE